ncbi:cupin domain-containing protein [Streptomyces sp. NPDC048606]|uniref:JmjC domain-containing protein n=1 Tax=Streptomyces sp. NPDC048606 TaxID=3154726 RepID=UPI0034289482
MTAFDAFRHADALLAGLGDRRPPAGGVRLHEPTDPDRDHAAREALLAGVWSALARPGALATNFRLVESGRPVDRSRWMRSRVGDGEILHTALVPAYLHNAVERGATLVISHLEALDDRVTLLREALEYLLCARAWVNCYITAGDSSAFDLHSDGHHTLILQLLGRKRWQVDSRTGARSTELADDSLDRVLTPGMCLSVPRDTAHRVSGTGELSIHLTVGYEPLAELDDASQTGRPAALRPDRRAGASLRSALTGDVGPSTRIRWAGRWPPHITTDDAHVTVTTMGRRIRLDRRLERPVVLLCGGGAFTFDSLLAAAGVPAADLRALVAFGARNDFLICEG